MTTEAVAHQRQVRYRLVNRCCPFADWHEQRRDPGGFHRYWLGRHIVNGFLVFGSVSKRPMRSVSRRSLVLISCRYCSM
jgi:hypothetical protein